MPSKRLAKCYGVGHAYAAFKYMDNGEEVTLCITFCQSNLIKEPALSAMLDSSQSKE